MWRGAIQFGLVTIPVRLYLATESEGIAFNMLHESCLNRIQMKIYCPHHDEVISRADTVKGYEYAKDQYVVITDEDLAQRAPQDGPLHRDREVRPGDRAARRAGVGS